MKLDCPLGGAQFDGRSTSGYTSATSRGGRWRRWGSALRTCATSSPPTSISTMPAGWRFPDATGPRAGIVARNRWRRSQLDEVQYWRTYGARRAVVRLRRGPDLDGLPPEILMVPLPGHSWGDAEVAVRRDGGEWLLHTGDACFYRGEMRQARPSALMEIRSSWNAAR